MVGRDDRVPRIRCGGAAAPDSHASEGVWVPATRARQGLH
jgi:hypothetical protein